MRLNVWGCWVVAGLICTGTAVGWAQVEFDLVIRGGRIVDGTGNPWFVGDVAIRDNQIVAVGRSIVGQAGREIDARDQIVCPGFIDIHSHSDDLLLEDGDAQSKIRQGVTTEILGEGDSAGPRIGQRSPRSMAVDGRTYTWSTLAQYLRGGAGRHRAQRRQLCGVGERLGMRHGFEF